MFGENRPDSTIIAKLPPEPQTARELQSILTVVATWSRDNVMLDMSQVDTLSRPSIYGMIQLYRLLTKQQRYLCMANVAPSTKQKIATSGGKSLFTIIDQCVAAFEPSPETPMRGHLTLVVRDRLRRPERREYTRFNIWRALPMDVVFHDIDPSSPQNPCKATLVDISQGGVRIAVSPRPDDSFEPDKPVQLELSSKTLDINTTLNAQIRTIVPTADGAYLSLGLQFSHTESDRSARDLVQRLCDLQSRYLHTHPVATA